MRYDADEAPARNQQALVRSHEVRHRRRGEELTESFLPTSGVPYGRDLHGLRLARGTGVGRKKTGAVAWVGRCSGGDWGI